MLSEEPTGSFTDEGVVYMQDLPSLWEDLELRWEYVIYETLIKLLKPEEFVDTFEEPIGPSTEEGMLYIVDLVVWSFENGD